MDNSLQNPSCQHDSKRKCIDSAKQEFEHSVEQVSQALDWSGLEINWILRKLFFLNKNLERVFLPAAFGVNKPNYV